MSFAGSASANVPVAVHNDIPATMDQMLHDITTTEDPKVLSDKLRHSPSKEARETILASMLQSGQDPLSVLDPERNTIGYLYILVARLTVNGAQSPSLRVIEEFCSRFNPEHARYAPERVTALAKGIAKTAESALKLKYALAPLLDLVTRYPRNLSFLTTIHTQFILACVATRHFSIALPVLSVPIINIDTTLSDLSYNDNLIYHYAGGMALGALKMWREAEEFFEICVSAPAQVPAAIQLEALKKLTLVQLILYGKPSPLPKYTNQNILRLFKQTPYFRLADVYPKPLPELQAIVSKENDVFTREENSGLIQQVLDRAPRWLIMKATQTYLTLNIADIAKETGNPSLDQNRAIILSMIENGEIEATISVDDTVTFSDSTTTVSKSQIDQALRRAQEQSALLLELEREVHSSKEYLSKALKYKEDAGWGQDEEAGYGMHGSGGSAAWAEDSMFG